MNSRREDDGALGTSRGIVSRRALLAASGVVAVGGLGGCLSRVASSVTNTTATPAAAFAGEVDPRNGDEASTALSVRSSDPHVSRLTPTVAGRAGGVSGEVELEGWVTSVAVAAANYNNSRSNRSTVASPESPVTDEQLAKILAYLGDEPIVSERFTVCLPDSEVPGGNGSIEDAVTPKRFVDYVTGQRDGDGRVYSWGERGSRGSGDCDDSGGSVGPGGLCGETGHLAAAVSGPMATGGGLAAVRGGDGTVGVVNSPPSAEGGASVLACSVDGEAYEPADLSEWGRPASGDDKASPYIADTLTVAQVMVQPPSCPHAFPGLLYVGRGRSDGQLVYTGGWVVDDASLYEDSVTLLTAMDAARIVGIDVGDLDSDGDGLGDAIERSLSDGGDRPEAQIRRRRRRRGARLDAGTVAGLAGAGVLSEGGREAVDHYVRKRPGRSADAGSDVGVTHLALDAPVLHLVNASGASNEVKFKAGAELSKA
jgi:hypothetical protein